MKTGLPYLRLPAFPTLDHLWSNLAETRRVRRCLTQHGFAEFAAHFGVTPDRIGPLVRGLRLRETLVERKIGRELRKQPAHLRGNGASFMVIDDPLKLP